MILAPVFSVFPCSHPSLPREKFRDAEWKRVEKSWRWEAGAWELRARFARRLRCLQISFNTREGTEFLVPSVRVYPSRARELGWERKDSDLLAPLPQENWGAMRPMGNQGKMPLGISSLEEDSAYLRGKSGRAWNSNKANALSRSCQQLLSVPICHRHSLLRAGVYDWHILNPNFYHSGGGAEPARSWICARASACQRIWTGGSKDWGEPFFRKHLQR